MKTRAEKFADSFHKLNVLDLVTTSMSGNVVVTPKVDYSSVSDKSNKEHVFAYANIDDFRSDLTYLFKKASQKNIHQYSTSICENLGIDINKEFSIEMIRPN